MNFSLPNFKHRHYGVRVMVLGVIAADVCGWIPLPDVAARIAAAASVWIMCAGILLVTSHRTGALCETCISEMPLDPETQAERKRTWLLVSHVGAGSRRQAIALWGPFFVLSVANWFLLHGVAYQVVRDALDAILALSLWSVMVHGKLGPWCPFCRKPGGGDGEDEVVPDPASPQFA